MPFKKGTSGNPKGRKKQSNEEKKQKDDFKKLLKDSTVGALESIVFIQTTNSIIEGLMLADF